MRPQLFVIAMSCLGCATEQPTLRDSARPLFDAKVYPVLAVTCGAPIANRPAHKFDYSPQELNAILAWRRLEREAL